MEVILAERVDQRLAAAAARERARRAAALKPLLVALANEEAGNQQHTGGGLISSNLFLWHKAFQYSAEYAPGPALSNFPSLTSLIPLDVPRPTEEAFNNVKPRLREELRIVAMKLRQSLVQLLLEVDNSATTESTNKPVWKFGHTELSDAELESVDAENLAILLHPSALFPVKTNNNPDGYCLQSYPEILGSAGEHTSTNTVIYAMRKIRPVAKDLANALHLESTNLWAMELPAPLFRCECCPKLVHNFFSWNDLVS